jgi:hypothetical protein
LLISGVWTSVPLRAADTDRIRWQGTSICYTMLQLLPGTNMAAPMPVSRRSAFAAIPPVSRPFIIRADGNHDFAATTILGKLGQTLVPLPHVGSGAAGRFVIGQTSQDSDTVFIAWARGGMHGASPAEFSIEQSGLVIASISARRRLVIDVPSELAGVETAYILWLSVRDGQLVVKMPPTGAMVSLDSITQWVTAGQNHYEARTPGFND